MQQTGNPVTATHVGAHLEELARLATGRLEPLFKCDVQGCDARLSAEIRDRRVLVIGGAGSIGAATVRALVPYRPSAIHIVDQNENGLVELIRDLRSAFDSDQLPDLRTVPLNFGGAIMLRFLCEEPPYDFVLNFAALKHVRSEKDTCSILQMLDTNVVKPVRLLQALVTRGGMRRYFSVSTDKAANPVNLMGASKRLMEHVIFSDEVVLPQRFTVSSARFANVAFSDGSLLQGWLQRLAKQQPIAAPKDTRRYFVSLQEAGQICLLAAFLAPDRHILVPRLQANRDLVLLAELATNFLRHFGYVPACFESESEARLAAAAGIKSGGPYPLLLTHLDTSGEKPYEEFLGAGERSVEVGLSQLIGVPYVAPEAGVVRDFLVQIERLLESAETATSKSELVDCIRRVLPEFHHQSSTKSLDQRI